MKSTIDGLCTPSAKKFVNISAFNPFNDPVVIFYYESHFKDEKIKTQRTKEIYSRSHLFTLAVTSGTQF